MLDEIDGAIRDAAVRKIPYRDISPENFPLPKTAALLAEARAELDEGPGFTVLSGFPVERYGYEENVLAYCGVRSEARRGGKGCVRTCRYGGSPNHKTTKHQ